MSLIHKSRYLLVLYMYMCVCVYVNRRTYTYTYIHTYKYLYISYIHVYVTHTHTHTYTHTRARAHTHAHIDTKREHYIAPSTCSHLLVASYLIADYLGLRPPLVRNVSINSRFYKSNAASSRKGNNIGGRGYLPREDNIGGRGYQY